MTTDWLIPTKTDFRKTQIPRLISVFHMYDIILSRELVDFATTDRSLCFMPQQTDEAHQWFIEHLHPHEPVLKSWLIKRFPDLQDADDIIQEAFLKVYIAHRRRGVRHPKSYLFSTARNLSINALRKARIRCENMVISENRFDVADSGVELCEQIQRAQDLELLTEAIQSLPDKCRRIFTLRKVYGMPQCEIAKRLGLSVHTVYSQVAIGLQKCSEYVARNRKKSVHETWGKQGVQKYRVIRAEASQWVAKHDLGLSDAEQHAFLDWLAEDPRHSQLFDEQIEMWQSFDVLEQWRPQHSTVPNPDLLATTGKDKRYYLPWVAACLGIAAITVLILTGVLFWQQSPSVDREPALQYLADSSMSKGYERHQLQDGTTVQLNRNSQVAVNYGPPPAAR